MIVVTAPSSSTDVLRLRRLSRPLRRQIAEAMALFVIAEAVECNDMD